ncbi:cell wall-binding repeat-containing protein [Agromyces sp. NPDC056523]|uniref:cell wall-binding repeat-containing protein n=1 Tax=Agromyces sp. NPDC056523 TaxID=3345850 RepID=UPI00366C3BD0
MSRALGVVLALTLTGAVIPTTFPHSAVAASGTTVTVTGRVYEETPGGGTQASAGASVMLLSADGREGVTPGSIKADATGLYTFTGVVPGLYRVKARPYVNGWDDVDLGVAYLGDTPFGRDATVISVASTAVSNNPITLPLAARLSGTITAPAGIVLQDDLRVEARQYNPESGAFEGAASNAGVRFDGGYVLQDLQPGLHLVSVSEHGGSAAGEYAPGTTSIDEAELVEVLPGDRITKNFDLEAAVRRVDRLAGPDRYATSAAISADRFASGVPVAYIANGLAFPDALGAGALGGVQGGPVLLTAPTLLPVTVAAELQRLRPERIVVVGSSAVVSDGVLRALRAYSADVDRLGGADRYATGRAIVRDAYPDGGASTVIIATGRDFPDALSAGAAGAANTAPLVLVNGLASTLDSATVQLLAELGPSEIVIAGSSAVVSVGIESALRRINGVKLVSRASGADRFATSRELTHRSPAFDTVYLTNGMDFPDALAGSAAAGFSLAALHLVRSACIPAETLDVIRWTEPNRIVLLGGPSVLGTGVARLTSC